MDQQNFVTHLVKEPKRKEHQRNKIYKMILNNPHMIEHIHQTADNCMLALILDHTCFSKIKNPTWTMKKFVRDRRNLEGNIIFEI